MANNFPIVENIIIDAAFGVPGDEDGFLIENPSTEVSLPINVQTFTGDSFATCQGVDTVASIFNDQGQRLRFDDDGGTGLCSFLNFTIPAGGRIIVHISHFSDNNTGAYRLRVRLNETLNNDGGGEIAEGEGEGPGFPFPFPGPGQGQERFPPPDGEF